MRRPSSGLPLLGLLLSAVPAAAQTTPAPTPAPPPTSAETPAPVLSEAPHPAEVRAHEPRAPAKPPDPPSDPATVSETPGSPEPVPDPPTPPAAPSPPVPSAAPPTVPDIEPAPDVLSRHFHATMNGILGAPFGSLERTVPWYDYAAAGPGLGLEAALGVSRSVALGLWGEMLWLGDEEECRGCATTTSAVGALFRYHLVQGMRFDPHISMGVGYRVTKTTGNDHDFVYGGIDWAHLVAGGDWYATRHLGLSPFFVLTAGATLFLPDTSPALLPPGKDRLSGVYGVVAGGIRLTLDVPGR
ncbi:MAG: hypothetical protein JW751_09105 [Polyangiaceae bacterium]|nr:hypothetical protein [Polyangiaceae bacterium]